MGLCCSNGSSNGWSLTDLLSIVLVSLLSPVLLLLIVYLKQAVQQLSIHGDIPVSPGARVCVWDIWSEGRDNTVGVVHVWV